MDIAKDWVEAEIQLEALQSPCLLIANLHGLGAMLT